MGVMDAVRAMDAVNAKLPAIKQSFDRIAELNQLIAGTNADIQSLFEIWGEGIKDERNPDHEFYDQKAERNARMAQEIQLELERIRAMGGIVKDVQKGLVDFQYDHDGGPIYLCWKVGEDKIRHWHPISSGFSARRPLDELLQASYV